MSNPWDVSDWNKDGTCLHVACGCKHGNLDIVKILVEHKADINKTNSFGVTHLMNACIAGHDHIVEYLLENGANASLTTKSGDSALSLAIYISSHS